MANRTAAATIRAIPTTQLIARLRVARTTALSDSGVVEDDRCANQAEIDAMRAERDELIAVTEEAIRRLRGGRRA